MLPGFHHHIENRDEPSHAGDHGNFWWLSGCQQPLILGSEFGIALRGRHYRHEQHGPDS